MYSVLHLGFEHPNLVWLVATAVLAFAAGLGVSMYRFFTTDESVSSAKNKENLHYSVEFRGGVDGKSRPGGIKSAPDGERAW